MLSKVPSKTEGEQTRRELVQIRADIQALRLVVSEALAIALSYDAHPNATTTVARCALKRLIDETEESMSTADADRAALQFNRWFMGAVQNSIASLMDDIEVRIHQLKRDRAVH
jgi:hypothetical protein